MKGKHLLFCTLMGVHCLIWGGCFSISPAERPHLNQLPLLSKDEIARINGRSLTLTDFIKIRSTLKQATNQKALWAGIAAYALQDEFHAKGRELPLYAALEIAQYAIQDLSVIQAMPTIRNYYSNRSAVDLYSPQEIEKDIERILSKSFVQKSPYAFAQLY